MSKKRVARSGLARCSGLRAPIGDPSLPKQHGSNAGVARPAAPDFAPGVDFRNKLPPDYRAFRRSAPTGPEEHVSARSLSDLYACPSRNAPDCQGIRRTERAAEVPGAGLEPTSSFEQRLLRPPDFTSLSTRARGDPNRAGRSARPHTARRAAHISSRAWMSEKPRSFAPSSPLSIPTAIRISGSPALMSLANGRW